MEDKVMEKAKKAAETTVDKKIDSLIRKATHDPNVLCRILSNGGDLDLALDKIKKDLEYGHDFAKTVYEMEISFHEPKEILCFRAEDTTQGGGGPSAKYPNPIDQDLYETYKTIFSRIVLSINNNQNSDYFDRSYSKSLVIPLFKYGTPTSTLAVKRLNTNTLLLQVQACYFTTGTDTPDGPAEDEPHSETVTVEIFLEDIHKKDKIEAAVREKISSTLKEQHKNRPDGRIPQLTHIFLINFFICGFTVDVSPFKRPYNYDIEKLSWDGTPEIHRYASYIGDQEIISDIDLSEDEIFSKTATEYLRILALFKIFGLETEYSLFKLCYDLKWGENLNVLWSYMEQNGETLREEYWKIVRSKDSKGDIAFPQYHVVSLSRDACIQVIDRLYQRRILSDPELYNHAKTLLSTF